MKRLHSILRQGRAIRLATAERPDSAMPAGASFRRPPAPAGTVRRYPWEALLARATADENLADEREISALMPLLAGRRKS